MSTEDPTLHTVTLTLCSLCLDGKGGECCQVPGCALRIDHEQRLSLRHNPMVEKIDGWDMCDACGMSRSTMKHGPEQYCGPCGVEAIKHV